MSFRDSVLITLDGKEYRLRYDFNALADLEDAMGGVPIAKMTELIGTGAKLSDVRRIFWAALRAHQPGTTLEQAGELIGTLDDLKIVAAGIRAAFEAAFPTVAGKTKKA